MSISLTIEITGLIFIVFTAFSLWYLRREYYQKGRLGRFGSLIHLAMFMVNGMFVSMLTWGANEIPPMGNLAWLGVPVMVAGLVIVVSAMDLFRQFSRWLGNDTPGLTTRGLYHLSRNPQFVDYGVFILGFEITWDASIGWFGLLSYLIMVYFVVRIEEDHLFRVYGQSYGDYCSRVPRFLGLTRK